VLDPAGAVVAADGERLAIPMSEWPRLHGHFACPGPDPIDVFLQDPS
jgi:hypothetical protein